MSNETTTSGASGTVTTGDRRAEIAAHTPGPWGISMAGFVYGAANDPNWTDDIVCNSPADDSPSLHYWNANARLIAAAPDMLAALTWLIGNKWKSDKDNMEFTGTISCYQMDKIRMAIAKATGGTNTSCEVAEQSEAIVP